MGGDITRTLENLPGFLGSGDFAKGKVHKLITIGTPHLGSPLASQLLQANNSCTRDLMARSPAGNVAIVTATVDGVPAVGGGIGDLQPGSAALGFANTNGHNVPTALLAGQATSANFAGLTSTGCLGARYIRHHCGTDPLAQNLTSTGWSQVFAGQASDAIVPVGSELAG